MDLIRAILFGIIEGLTEWLPISSTGHMILAEEWIKMDLSAKFMEMFLVVIQFGAILAVIVLYFHKLNPFSGRKSTVQKRETVSLWMKVLCACVPAGIIGVLFDDPINALFYNYKTVAITLILYGVFFILVENRNRGRIPSIRNFSSLSYRTAFIIGIFQVLALIPGTSRSGATILGAILIGTSREIAAEFTFFLAIPIMFGASLLKMVKFGFAYTPMEAWVLLLGMATAFLVSVFAIRFLVGYIKKHDFKPFGYYRIILGIVVLLYFGLVH
ncbi:Undecaprenyl-diphosphatase [Caprobacter fermentans]|uniref:Undecaprenyl-diphosphatase n=1 Tax=Caproicibacter fermentans TaxID=2576756 RepID=A0A6N8I3G9_9FIRM|nr:undecaprenyl-diphosphate phosphatase [Caproicibacter fermentans]MVB12498.1 Undecaprenyl-diphosphatase [Caproicibacter fermentans]